MPKIKEVYEYNNGSWANGTPIGADASNVDVALSDSTSTKDLQSVLGNVSVSDPSMKTQLTGKVNASGGDIKDTVVSVLDPASETDTSEDIDGTDVVVAAGESQTTMWSKFNMFRKRVSNKFSNFLISSVEDVVTPSDTKTYSQAALNSYFADVIGYKTDADVADVGSVADQLSTLNNKTANWIKTVSTSGGYYIQLNSAFLIQFGSAVSGASAGNATVGVSFQKAFANTSYGIVVSGGHNASQGAGSNPGTFISETAYSTGSSNRTTTSCTVSVYKTGLAYPVTIYWIAWGTPAS